ncbi:transforming growth factor-beta-induced protein ig-h3-like [Zootermopsis nevadensis]|uniref:Transforming growth factor-beta-induced protein ig-h3 n=1 Tax=Zootermopsis nevadensis TaxID=136037 RepID=A0A067QQV1_ZOONE|nr:transforming growth factor-beta-induced protein ig-h3-like [Zootermopsis nevadensis]KDR10948.1 Transforming growth factor-beta-induced protein ig-h3 [Zootermopsis nevadensis]
MSGRKIRSFETLILTVFVIGIVLPSSTEGFFSYNPFRRAATLFDGHDFWSQFRQGFKQLEDAAEEEAQKLESTISHTGNQKKDESSSTELLDPMGSSDIGFSGGLLSNLFGSMGAGFAMARQPWWKGPNVCVEREEIDESQHLNHTDETSGTNGDDEEGGLFGSFQFSSCQQTDVKYTCTTKIRNHGIRKTFVVKYQCCHGFRRVEEKPGCSEVHLKSLLETAADVGAKDFVQLVHTSGLEEKTAASNLTLFVPSDDAVRDFTDSLQEANQVEFYVPPAFARRRRETGMEGTSMRDIVLGHMVPGLYDMSELVNEQVLYSDNANSSVRVNFYHAPGERLMTANCARLTSVNNYATNGIVHVVDRMIRPVTKTLAQLLAQDSQFSVFISLLSKSGLLQTLKEPGHVTIFAPTDSAFEKLDPTVRSRLLDGEACVGNVLRHHLIQHSVCSAAIQTRLMTVNMDGDTLSLERRPDDGKLFVSGVQIVAKDVVGTNGIIHVIDDIIMPDSARPVTGVLASHNLTTFLSLLREAGLAESLDSMKNVTLFAPTDEALARPESVSELEKLRTDKDRLRDLLLYHTTGPEVQLCDFSNDKELKSGLADQSIRINLYATLPFFTGAVTRATAQCARVINFDNRACGGVVHEVDKLLMPPTGSILELIEKGDNYTLLRKIIKGTGLEDDLSGDGPFTFLAPTDSAFYKLEEEDLKTITEDKHLAARVLRQHLLPEALCCTGVSATSWPFTNRVETLGGRSVAVRRDHEGRVHIGSAMVQDCDIPATNGIIHSVNRVMVPHGNKHNGSLQKFGNPNVEVFLYGL